MPRERSIYVTQMGSLYRLTRTNWMKYLDARSKGWVNIENFGELQQTIIPNVTDWDEGRAQFELDDMEVRGA